MSKTWRQIRSETINLGFEKIKSYEKNPTSYVEAFNWAQKFLASVTDCCISALMLDKSEQAQEIFDLESLCSAMGLQFSHMAQMGAVDSHGVKMDGTALLSGRFLCLPDDFVGEFTVYVNTLPKSIAVDSPDDTALQVSDKWRNVLPYLMANRLFLDDDPQLATYYWNLADDMKNQILRAEYPQTVSVNCPANDGWWY